MQFFTCTILSGQQQQRYILPLSEEVLYHKELNAASISNVLEVVDLAGDSTLGYLPTPEGNNDRIAVYPPAARQDWLNLLVNSAGAEKAVKAGSATLIVITDISVGGNEKVSFTKVRGSIYESPLGKESYTKTRSIDDFYLNRSLGLSKSGENIAGLIMNALSSSSAAIVIKTGRPMSKGEVIKAEQEKLQFISSGIFPPGIYKSFEEFKLLKPAYGQFYLKVDTLNKTVHVSGFEIGDSTLHVVENAFAVAVGSELYLCRNNQLYPAEVRGNSLCLSKYIDPATRRNQARFWLMNLGSQISGIYGNPFDNVYAITLKEFKGQQVNAEVTKINVQTGQLEL
ncbi:hypothetical protein GCM10027516_11680 [Niabella aquatica]